MNKIIEFFKALIAKTCKTADSVNTEKKTIKRRDRPRKVKAE